MGVKRFVVFAGFQYYPGGGWEDFIGSCDTLEEARELRRATLEENYQYSWSHIVDLQTGEVVR